LFGGNTLLYYLKKHDIEYRVVYLYRQIRSFCQFPLKTQLPLTKKEGGAVISGYSGNFFKNHIIDNTAKNFIIKTPFASVNANKLFNFNTITRNITTEYNFPTSSIVVESSLDADLANCSNNNLFGNKATYEFRNNSLQGSDVNANNCWWGTTSITAIEAKIWDYFDSSTLSIADYTPFATSPDTAAPVTPPINAIKKDLGGGSIQLTWNANAEIDLGGYKVYSGSPTGFSFSRFVNVGDVTTYMLAGASIN
jgi:hypothetical protein